MSKRTLIAIGVTSAIVVAIGGTALAKGPESATITGPGIDEPIEIELIETANPDLLRKLMGQTGLWFATGGGSRIPTGPGRFVKAGSSAALSSSRRSAIPDR